jgi:hypothetical protein
MSKNTDLGSLVNYIKGQVTGRLNAPAYTSATAFTGTIAGYLGFDTSGNILTSAAVGVTSVSGTGTVSGLTLTGTVTTTGSLTLGGTLSLTSGNVTTALGYTPVTSARTLTINGTSYDLSADRSWTISGVTGSGSTNYMPLWTSTTGLGNSIIYNNAGNLGINSTTDGYTLNAIRSASTAFSDTFKGTGGTIQIMARFMQDESTKKGIAIGYNATFSYSAIFGTQDGANLRIGVLSGSLYKAMIVLSTNTVSMDLPTSGGGLTSGMLYNDGGTVKIIT